MEKFVYEPLMHVSISKPQMARYWDQIFSVVYIWLKNLSPLIKPIMDPITLFFTKQISKKKMFQSHSFSPQFAAGTYHDHLLLPLSADPSWPSEIAYSVSIRAISDQPSSDETPTTTQRLLGLCAKSAACPFICSPGHAYLSNPAGINNQEGLSPLWK